MQARFLELQRPGDDRPNSLLGSLRQPFVSPNRIVLFHLDRLHTSPHKGILRYRVRVDAPRYHGRLRHESRGDAHCLRKVYMHLPQVLPRGGLKHLSANHGNAVLEGIAHCTERIRHKVHEKLVWVSRNPLSGQQVRQGVAKSCQAPSQRLYNIRFLGARAASRSIVL